MKKLFKLINKSCGLKKSSYLMALFILLLLAACTPRVEVAVPDKPITINMNVKIDHEVKVKVDKDLDKVLNEDGELF